jgi:K+-sensing histidine kinase KdpD
MARERIDELVALLETHPSPETAPLIEECAALARAIAAFHMEGIRFRMYNVDRLVTRAGAGLPERSAAILEEARHHLESAGFHTRSHQAPS